MEDSKRQNQRSTSIDAKEGMEAKSSVETPDIFGNSFKTWFLQVLFLSTENETDNELAGKPCRRERIRTMRLCHPPDGSTSPKYKLCFKTTKKNFAKRRTH